MLEAAGEALGIKRLTLSVLVLYLWGTVLSLEECNCFLKSLNFLVCNTTFLLWLCLSHTCSYKLKARTAAEPVQKTLSIKHNKVALKGVGHLIHATNL